MSWLCYGGHFIRPERFDGVEMSYVIFREISHIVNILRRRLFLPRILLFFVHIALLHRALTSSRNAPMILIQLIFFLGPGISIILIEIPSFYRSNHHVLEWNDESREKRQTIYTSLAKKNSILRILEFN